MPFTTLEAYRAGAAFGSGLLSAAFKVYGDKSNTKFLDVPIAATLLGGGYALPDSPQTNKQGCR